MKNIFSSGIYAAVATALLVLLFAGGESFGQTAAGGKFIENYAASHNFNGTVLVQKGTNVNYEKSFGLANFQFKVPNRNETKYKIASITKLFTSVLIMQLAEREKLEVDKTIKNYLPDYRGEAADKVTIRQLLNHTSGMANMETVKSLDEALTNGLAVFQKPRTSDDLLRDFCSGKLVNPPGKVFDYNNGEYIILGKIIENICHQSYDEVLAEHILKPLNLTNTGLMSQEKIIEGLADTYLYREDLKKLAPDLPVYMENWYAAGAMFSTADDLRLFSDALFGGRLLKSESLKQMFTSGLGEYGYGVWVYENYEIQQRKFTIIKRPGRIMGAQGMLFHILEEGSTIIILSNTGTTSLDDFAAEIARQVIN